MSDDTVMVRVVWTETAEYEREVRVSKKRWRKMREEFSEAVGLTFDVGDKSLPDALHEELDLADGLSTIRDTGTTAHFQQATAVRRRKK